MYKIKKTYRNCCIWLLVGIVVFLIYVAFGINEIYGHRTPDLEEISEYIHIGFPKGAMLIGSDMNPEFRQDNTILARIRFPRSGMRAFIKSLPKPVNTSTSDRLGVSSNHPLSDPPDWWQPDEVRPFYAIGVNMAPKSGRMFDELKILFDTSEKDTVELYLYWESD